MSYERRPDSLTLATFNIHAGVDGWGRPFDVVSPCSSLGADVIILQESWTPDGGAPSTAGRIAERLGYQLVAECTLARGLLLAPPPTETRSWGPLFSRVGKALLLDGEHRPDEATTHRGRAVRGSWGVAMLARVPFGEVAVTPLGQLRRDPARRVVVRATVPMVGGDLVVCGTHMSHITHGSHAQYRVLSEKLPPATTPALLAGDMNLWGPPTTSYLRGWRRAVKGRSWPAHRPHSQLDHILVTRPVAVLNSRISEAAGSDHRPAVATVSLATSDPVLESRIRR